MGDPEATAAAYHFCRFTLGLTFLLAGVSKLMRPRQFARTVTDFRLIPDSLAVPAAALVVTIELIGGLLLLLGIRVPEASGILLLLLALFTLALAIVLARGQTVSCLCFGDLSSSDVSPWSMGRNLCLAAVGAMTLLFGRGSVPDLPPGDYAVVVFMAISVVGVLMLLSQADVLASSLDVDRTAASQAPGRPA